MKSRYTNLLFCLIFLFSCGTSVKQSIPNSEIPSSTEEADYTIAFGSCNKQYLKNDLWDDILKQNPDLWIWGGDNIYADTDSMQILKAEYMKQRAVADYKKLVETIKIMGTWDDHDYGLNDGGEEFKMKKESQQEFLDFIGVPQNDKRRKREGIYHAEVIKTAKGTIKIIVLDTRYFRSSLVTDDATHRRYKATTDRTTTILGEEQWQWFKKELNDSNADFNIIVGSIQFLSVEHGYETWGNFPHEIERLQGVILNSRAKGVVLLSGDRHISEFSKIEINGLGFPLIDFTSSGLTHTYSDFKSEPNKNRVGDVVSIKSFGLLQFNFKQKQISMKMYANENKILQQLIQRY